MVSNAQRVVNVIRSGGSTVSRPSGLGFQSRAGGGAALVTPSGSTVSQPSGSFPTIKGGGGGGGSTPTPAPTSAPAPTPTETIVGQSLTQDIRQLPPQHLPRRPSFAQEQIESIRGDAAFGMVERPVLGVEQGGAIPTGAFAFFTPEERARLKGSQREQFAIEVSPGANVLGGVEAGIITSQLSTGISPARTSFGDVPGSLRKEAGARGQDIQEIIDLRKQQVETIKDVSKQFQEDPESFRGQPGFEQVDAETGLGTEFRLGPKFFEELPSTKRLAEFTGPTGEFVPQTRPSDVKLEGGGRSFLAGAGIGATQFAIGTVEATLAIPFSGLTQTSPTGDFKAPTVNIERLPIIKDTGLGDFTRDIKSADISLGEQIAGGAAIAGPLVVAGGVGFVKQVGKRGFKGATRETALTVSDALAPIRVKSGIFAPPTKFETVAIKEPVGDDIFRLTLGKGKTPFGPAEKISLDVPKEIGGGVVGRGAAVIKTPAISIDRGLVRRGDLLVTGKTGFKAGEFGGGRFVKDFGGPGVLDIGAPLPSGGGVGFFQPKKALFLSPGKKVKFDFADNLLQVRQFGGVSRDIGGARQFATGELTGIDKFLGRTRRIRFRPQEKGIEFDLKQSDILGTGGGLGRRGPKPTTKQRNIFDNLPSPPTPQLKPITLEAPALGVVPKTTLRGSGQGITQSLVGQTPQQLAPRSRQAFSPIQIPALSEVGRQRVKPGFATVVGISEALVQPTAQAPALGISERIGFKPATRIETILTAPSVARPSFGFDFGFGRIVPPPFPVPSPGIFDAPRGKAKGKRRLRRTPSLISVELGITKTPFTLAQERTGLAIRGFRPPRKRKRKSKR